jgi:hypothetical protein
MNSFVNLFPVNYGALLKPPINCVLILSISPIITNFRVLIPNISLDDHNEDRHSWIWCSHRKVWGLSLDHTDPVCEITFHIIMILSSSLSMITVRFIGIFSLEVTICFHTISYLNFYFLIDDIAKNTKSSWTRSTHCSECERCNWRVKDRLQHCFSC